LAFRKGRRLEPRSRPHPSPSPPSIGVLRGCLLIFEFAFQPLELIVAHDRAFRTGVNQGAGWPCGIVEQTLIPLRRGVRRALCDLQVIVSPKRRLHCSRKLG
jgi:hypothetical protein